MKKIQLFAPLFALLFFQACEKELGNATLQPNCELTQKSHPNADKYQRIADKFMDAGAVGVSITVKTPEGTWSVASGKADLKNDIDLTPCHTLRIGSISKTFTAATILKLQEAGLLDINDKASQYLPDEYVDKIGNLDKATIQQLLNHTSGVPEYLGIGGILDIMNQSIDKRSAKESMKVVFGKKGNFEVGEKWEYANSNYLLLAMIIEKVTQKPAFEAVTEFVLQPLGLENTFASITIPATFSRGYYDNFGNGIMRDQTETDHSAVGGQDMLDGGMISNSLDLALFMEALGTVKLLSDQSMAAMKTFVTEGATSLPDDLRYIKGYGLGLFDIQLGETKRALGHGGNVFCFNGIAYYFQEQKTSVSIILNSYSKALQTALYDEETLRMLF